MRGWDVRALDLPDAFVAQKLLEEAAVLVSPGYQFRARGIGHLRLCCARDEREWEDALEQMIAVLDDLYMETSMTAKHNV